ncbi:MAG: CHAT domain-containing protein [Flavobacteriaceae bacterium]|nr:CHAT domain-containing protein [Flavobacteriaceae bacterium]
MGSAQSNLKQSIDSIVQIENLEEQINAYEDLVNQQDTLVKTGLLGVLYYKLANTYYKAKVNDKAFTFFKKAIKFNHSETYNLSRFELSRLYARLNDHEKEREVLIDIIKDAGNDKYTCYSYRLLARNESDKGDFSQAIYFLNQGLSNTALCKNPKYESELRFQIIEVYAEKLESTFNLDKNHHDFKIIKNHQNLIIKDSLSTNNQNALLNNLALLYDSFNELDKALILYDEAFGFYTQNNKSYALDVLNNMSVIYYKQKKYRLAKTCYDKIISSSNDEYQLAIAYDNRGYYLPNASAFEKLPYFKKAIQTLLGNRNSNTYDFVLPSITDIKILEHQQDLLPYLIDLADHYVDAYHECGDSIYLIKARETCFVLDKLISLLRNQSDALQSKRFWIEKGVDLYMLAVNVCYLLNDVENGFYFMEKNKALMLQEQIKQLQAKLASEIPQDVIEREQQLYYNLQQAKELFNDGTNDSIKALYNVQNQIYDTFIDSIRVIYPDYTKTKQETTIIELKNVISDYKTKSTHFIEYILNNKDGYGIYYNGDVPVFFKIPDVPKLQKDIDTLMVLMKKRYMNSVQTETFQVLNHSVFKRLFPFKDAVNTLKGKSITIVTDDALRYLPFEALLTNDKKNLLENYLIQSTEVTYLQSFSLTKELKVKQNTSSQKLLMVAPTEFLDSDLPHLNQTSKVLDNLYNYANTLILSKSAATKANFIKHQGDYEIIHFNTHAGIDSLSQKPWVAFHDTKMTLYDLYGFENNANLVILDACKTNDGQQYAGEGVLNLSRGFFYNGSKSVLASLWNVNEISGNQIIKMFYQRLQQGHSKSKALQLAKTQYLQHGESYQKLPYYWAAFTLTGITDAIVLPVKTDCFTYIVLGVIVLLLLIIFVYKKNSNYTKN